MATSLKTRNGTRDRPSPPRRRRQRAPSYPGARQASAGAQVAISRPDATAAVARAFARVMAARYPGTSWLPVEPARSDDRFVVPARKVVRLLPGPADMDAGGGVGRFAAPCACERAPDEHGADTGAQ
jgi:hypothetical protein